MSRESNTAPGSGYDRFSFGVVIRISVTQLVLGFVTIAFTIPIIVVTHDKYYGPYYSLNAYVGTGIWVGFFFILNGAFGLHATNLQYNRKKSPGSILTTLVMNSINILFASTLTILSGYSAYGTNKHCPLDDYYQVEKQTRILSWGEQPVTEYQLNEKCANRNAMLALDTLLMLIGLAQLIMAVFSVRFAKAALDPSEVSVTADREREGNAGFGFSYPQKKIIRILAVIQIMLSVACIAFGIASTVTSHSDKNISLPITYSIVGLTGADVWCGVIFLVISLYHLCTIYKSDKQARAIASTVLSAFGVLLSITLIVLSAMSMSLTNKPCKPGYKAHSVCKKINSLFALDLMSFLIGLVQLGFIATYLVFSIKVLLRRNVDSSGTEDQTAASQSDTVNHSTQLQTTSHQTGPSLGLEDIMRVVTPQGSHSAPAPQENTNLPPEYATFLISQPQREPDHGEVPDVPPPSYETLNL